jgi:hypothetical protein
MARDQAPSSRNEPNATEDEFEELVAAVLKVDPTGISGKHRHEGDQENDQAK